VQFENVAVDTLEDGKLVLKPPGKVSWYRDFEQLDFINAKSKILAEARRQVAAAEAAGLHVEWLVSDQTAVANLTKLFRDEGVDVGVRYLPE
jgi:hypothetical protein